MKYFVLNSPAFDGEITFKYDFDGFLIGYENCATLNQDQMIWVLKNLPIELSDIEAMQQKKMTGTIKEIKKEITFEMFYNLYGYKEDKQEAEKVWNKLSDREKQEAYEYVPKYKIKLASNSGIARKYPKTYLRQKPWIQ